MQINDTSADRLTSSVPVVSVIIPYYRQEAFLADTVESVRNAGYPNTEIIVVDDGSPVTAQSVLGDSDDVLIVRTENRGRNAARNYGFQKSTGQYLIFLDSDDRLVPGGINAHLTALQRHPDAVLSFGALRMIDEHNKEIRPPHICRPREDYFLMLLEGNPIGCPGSAMLRRDAFAKAGGFDETLHMAEEYLLYLQLARTDRLVQVGSCVAEYRVHSGNTSRNKEAMLKATLGVLDRVEREMPLSVFERKRLLYGRRRWAHEMRRRDTAAYRLASLYYGLRAMLSVSPTSYFRGDRSTT